MFMTICLKYSKKLLLLKCILQIIHKYFNLLNSVSLKNSFKAGSKHYSTIVVKSVLCIYKYPNSSIFFSIFSLLKMYVF